MKRGYGEKLLVGGDSVTLTSNLLACGSNGGEAAEAAAPPAATRDYCAAAYRRRAAAAAACRRRRRNRPYIAVTQLSSALCMRIFRGPFQLSAQNTIYRLDVTQLLRHKCPSWPRFLHTHTACMAARVVMA